MGIIDFVPILYRPASPPPPRLDHDESDPRTWMDVIVNAGHVYQRVDYDDNDDAWVRVH